MEFIDLAAQQKVIKEKIERNIQGVLAHGRYIMGPEVMELERTLAAYTGVKHGISCASGTDALLMALMAYGIGPGHAVLTSPFTFVATAEVISLLGATPVFVDIDPVTFNLDPEHLEKAIEAVKAKDPAIHPLPINANSKFKIQNSKLELIPKGIIAVDLFGLPAAYDDITATAKRQGMFVIEDAAQSFGAAYKGQKACSLGDIGCTSFFPAKPLGAYGDGGMVFTDDDDFANAMVSIRIHGQGNDKYENIRVGINGRLDTLQAAVLLAKFEIFPEEIERRQEVAQRYDDLLSPLVSEGVLTTPQIPNEMTSAWAQYSVLAKDERHRKALLETLSAHGIPTAIYYPKPLHLQTAFGALEYGEGDFPVSEEISRRIMSLPMHPYLETEDQERICNLMGVAEGRR